MAKTDRGRPRQALITHLSEAEAALAQLTQDEIEAGLDLQTIAPRLLRHANQELERRLHACTTALEQARRDLHQRTQELQEATELLTTTRAELEQQIEELSVADEELREQYSELEAARGSVNAERARYQELFDEAPDPYLVTDIYGHVQQANLAAQQAFGWKAEFLQPKPLALFLPAEARRAFDALLHSLHTEPQRARVRLTIRPAEAPEFPADVTVTPILAPRGEAVGFRWLVRDTSEQVRGTAERERLLTEAQEQRQHAEDLEERAFERSALDTIVEHTQAQLAYLDRDFNFIVVNSAYAAGSGYAESELIGRNHFDLFPNAENQSIFEYARDSGETVRFVAKPYEYPDQPERGVTYWDWALTPVKDETGAVTGLVFSLLDVTDRERGREHEREHQRRLEALLHASTSMLGAPSLHRLLHRVADAARELTGATMAVAGRDPADGAPVKDAFALAPGATAPPQFAAQAALRAHRRLLELRPTIHLTADDLEPEAGQGETAVSDMLGARLVNSDGEVNGVILVANKATGAFDAEDEALLQQLANTASLALQQLRARNEAEERAAQLDAVLDAMTEGVSVYDAAGNLVRSNPALREFYGQDPSTSTAEERIARIHSRYPDGTPVAFEDTSYARLMRGETVTGRQLLLANARGEDRSMILAGAPLQRGGEPAGAVLVWHDVTELERARREAARQAALLEAVFQARAEGVAISDSTGTIRRANETYRQWFGDVEGAASTSVIERAKIRHPDGRPLTPEDQASALLRRGQPAQGLRRLVTTQDGHERSMLVSASAVESAEGFVGTVVSWHDVTDVESARHAAERAQAEAEQRALELQAVFDALTDAVLVYDETAGLVRYNRAVLDAYGIAPLSLSTRSERLRHLQLRLPDGRAVPPSQTPSQRALRGETITAEPWLYTDPRGQTHSILISASPVVTPAGRGAVVAWHDVTELNEASRVTERHAATLSAMFDALADGVLLLDAAGSVVGTNRAAIEALGYDPSSPEQRQQAPRYILRHLDGRPLARDERPMRRVAAGERIMDERYLLRIPGHPERTVLLSAAPLETSEGFAGAVATFHDITELEAARAEADARAAELAATFDAISDGVLIIRSDQVVARANPAAVELLGFDPTGTQRDKRQQRYHFTHPDGETVVTVEQSPAYRAMQGERVRGMRSILHRHGAAPRSMVSSAAPLPGDEGRKAAVVVWHDVSELEDARMQAEQNAARLNAIIQAMREAVLVLDTNGRVVQTNASARRMHACDITGLTFGEFSRRLVMRTADNEPVEARNLPGALALQGEVVTEALALFTSAAGEDRRVRVSAAPFFIGQGIAGAVAVWHDVTELEAARAEAEARAAELRATVNSMTDGLLVLDGKGKVVQTNAAAVGLVGPEVEGMSRPEFVAHTHMRHLNGEPVAADETPGMRAVHGEVVAGEEYAFTDHEGVDRVALVAAAPLRTGMFVTGAVTIWHDITELHRVRAEAEARAAQLTAMFESLVDAVLIIDRDGKAVDANPAAIDSLGYDPRLLSADERRAGVRLLDEQGRRVPRENLPSQRAMHGEHVIRERVYFELPNGERRVRILSAIPMQYDEGLLGVVLAWHDVTELEAARAQAEASAREIERQQRLLQQMVNSAPIGIAIVEGPEDRYRLVNPEYQANPIATQPPVAGGTLAESLPHLASRIGRLVRRIYETGEAVRMREDEFTPARGGENVFYDVDMVPLFDATGKVENVLILAGDVTEHVRARRRIEQLAGELAAQREFLSAIIETSPVGISVVSGPDHRIELVNPSFAAIPGVPGLEMPGHTIAEVLPDFYAQGGKDYLDRVYRSGEHMAMREYQTPVGPLRPETYWDIDLVPLSDERTLFLAHEITTQVLARKAAEHARAEAQALADALAGERRFLDNIMDNVPAAITYVGHDMVFRQANRAAARLLGHTIEDVINHPMAEVLSPNPQVQRKMKEVLRTGEPFRGIMALKLRGETEPREFQLAFLPDRDASGRVAGVFTTATDVSELVATRRALEDERARLQAILENAPVGVVATDNQARVLFANELAIELYQRPLPLGEDFASHVQMRLTYPNGVPWPPRDLPLTRSALDGETSLGVDMDVVWPDGQRRNLLVNTAPIRDASGAVLGAVGMFQDITPLKQAQQRLIDTLDVSEQRAREVSALLVASRAVAQQAGFDTVAHQIRVATQDLLGARSAYLSIATAPSPDGDVLAGEGVDLVLPARAQEVLNEMYRTGRVQFSNDLDGDEDHHLLQNILVAPVIIDGNVEGVLALANKPDGMSEADAGMAYAFAEIAAIALRNERNLQALRESEERFRSVTETASDAIVAADGEGRIQLWNAAAEQMFGYRADEAYGQMLSIIMPNRSLTARDARAADGPVNIPEGQSFEEVGLRRDGERFPIEVSLARWRAGADVYLTAIIRDITERKRADESLRLFARRLQVLREIDQGVLAAGSAEEIAFAAVRRMDQLIPVHVAGVATYRGGSKVLSLLATMLRGETRVLPRHGTAYSQEIVDVLERGLVWHVDDLSLAAPTSRAVRRLQASGIRSFTCIPLLAQEELVGVLELGRETPGRLPPDQLEIAADVAAQLSIGLQQTRLHAAVRAHAADLEDRVARRTIALRASQARLRAVIENAPIGVGLLNLDGLWVEVNSALQRLTGWTEAEMRDRSILAMGHPDDLDQNEALFHEALSGREEQLRVEMRYVNREGRTRWANVILSLVRLEGNQPAFWIAMVDDTTEERQAKDALIQSEKLALTGQMAASFAHEINNPLQSVIGCLALAEENMADGRDSSRYMKVAREELRRAADIVGRLRNLHRPSQSEDLQQVSIGDVINQVLTVTRKRLEEVYVQVEWQRDETLPTVYGVADRLQQVFMNIVLNATDAMPEGGKLTIVTEQTTDPGGVRIKFTDTGVGIPPETLRQMFEPFFSTKRGGLGLGLFISRGIIRDHGGDITVDSEPGHGTTFAVWLPA